MCWVTKNEDCLYRMTADKDIPVFKIVHDADERPGYVSYYYGAFYIEGQESTSYLEEPLTGQKKSYSVNHGIHSYGSDIVKVSLGWHIGEIRVYVIFLGECLDACIYDQEYINAKDIYRLDCIIPKGSKYYLNEYGEYVSNKIIPVKSELLVNEEIASEIERNPFND